MAIQSAKNYGQKRDEDMIILLMESISIETSFVSENSAKLVNWCLFGKNSRHDSVRRMNFHYRKWKFFSFSPRDQEYLMFCESRLKRDHLLIRTQKRAACVSITLIWWTCRGATTPTTVVVIHCVEPHIQCGSALLCDIYHNPGEWHFGTHNTVVIMNVMMVKAMGHCQDIM